MKPVSVDKSCSVLGLYQDGQTTGISTKSVEGITADSEINKKIFVVWEDITKLKIDVVVNASNTALRGGLGVNGAIQTAAGPKLLEELIKQYPKGGITGQSYPTKAYNLPAKEIFHAIGPIITRTSKTAVSTSIPLASCYRRSLELLVERGHKSIAFPNISTAIFGYPIEEACPVALGAVRNFLESEKGQTVEQVVFVQFNPKDYPVYMKNLPCYFPLTEDELLTVEES